MIPMQNKKSTEIPKSAYNKPSKGAIIFFVIVVLLFVPNTLPFYTHTASVQSFLLIILSPLIIPGLVASYHAGISVSKYAYRKRRRWYAGPLKTFIALLIMYAICVFLCVEIEFLLAGGNPIEMCFDTCQRVSLKTAQTAYMLYTAAFFVPAFCGACRYFGWHYSDANNGVKR